MAQPNESAAGRYLDGATLDKIKRLDVRARVVVEGFMTGSHRSPYHGFAVEFAAHREYAPGDDLRYIDWKVWSKTDRLYIKEFEEETNLKCHLLLDRSKSMEYGAEKKWSKFDHAATAVASLAYLMQQQQDSVGLTLFSNEIDKNFKPSTHPSHLKLLFHELEQTRCDQKTEVADAFLQLANQFRQRGMVLLVSDLLLPLNDLDAALKQFRLRRHEVIVFHVMHSDELTFPFDENTLFKGLEVEIQLLTEPRQLKKAYLEAMEKHMEGVRRICSRAGIDYCLLDTSKSLDATLSSYLNFRLKSRRRLTGRG
ncbi:MAG: DUF58 domain-containing protein [Pirellulaceae bacterium]|jgi:uncharacterized protein (DUF58 family)